MPFLRRSLPGCAGLAVSLLSLLPLHAAMPDTANPLLVKSPLPLEFPQFDLYRNEHFGPALEASMAAHREELRAITSNPAAPTFENTLVALERSGVTFSRVYAIFSNLVGAHTNPELDRLDAEYAPKIAAHFDTLWLDEALFARVDALYQKRAELKLDAESLRLLEDYHRDFVLAGARLQGAQKERMKEINAELASLQSEFGQKVLKETNDGGVLVERREDLDGMSESDIAAAAAAATAAGQDGKYRIALLNTSGQPLLSSLKNRALRQRLHEASLARGNHGGPNDTREIVVKQARLRAERAQLLGFATFADSSLANQTAAKADAVNKLLSDLAPAAVANARREAAEMQRIIDREQGGFQLAAWDWSFYSERVRAEKYAFDESQLKPYFELNHVMFDGVFFAAQKFYGLTFKERKDLPVYEPSVRVFEVHNEDGSLLSLLTVDLFARPSKRGGAWMNSYVDQARLLGTKAVVGNHLNIPQPPAGQPALLTEDEVKTFFHEFGHALHGMLSNVHYPKFSGTNVPRDFVEFPSQVNEMWYLWPEVLENYARHYQTGAPMPKELVAKLLEARKFNQGFLTTEYLAASLLDQAWHQLKPEQVPTAENLIAFEKATLARVGLDFAPVPPRYRTTYFNHAFTGGYSAGYYSYLWSEVLDAQTVEWIKTHGGLTRANGDHMRRVLLSRGKSVDAMVIFRELCGADPDVKPMLVRRGLN